MSNLALYNKLLSLPEDLRAQALDFIDLLLQKKIKEQPKGESKDPDKNSKEKILRLEDFNFLKSQEILKDVKGTPLSDLLIEERRTGR